MKTLRFLAGALGVVGCVLFLTAATARADCNPDNAIFQDDFEFMDGSWGDPTDRFYVEDEAMVVKDWAEQINSTTQNQGANVCVDMTAVEVPKPEESPLGLIFWWQDWDNFYYAWYWTNSGTVAVNRVVKGKVQNVLQIDTLAVKKGVGATNHFEIDLRAKDATLFINGTQVTRFKGVQPKDGGIVGLIALSADGAPGTFKFDNLIVSEPSESAQ